MSEPLKQRVDFSQQSAVDVDSPLKLKQAQAFDPQTLERFIPQNPELEQQEQEGEVEGLINAALKPKRSFWRRLVTAAIAIFGVSVLAQLGQWIYQSWVTQDWTALESRRRVVWLWWLGLVLWSRNGAVYIAYVNEPKKEIPRANYCIVMAWGKALNFVKN